MVSRREQNRVNTVLNFLFCSVRLTSFLRVLHADILMLRTHFQIVLNFLKTVKCLILDKFNVNRLPYYTLHCLQSITHDMHTHTNAPVYCRTLYCISFGVSVGIGLCLDAKATSHTYAEV